MKMHILGRNALNCALYLKFNAKKVKGKSKSLTCKTKCNPKNNKSCNYQVKQYDKCTDSTYEKGV